MVSRRRGDFKARNSWYKFCDKTDSFDVVVVITAAAVTLKLPLQHQLIEIRGLTQVKTI
jgi:hypothetical protein